MKLSSRRLLSFLLILSLFAAFLSAGAFAVDLPEISCDLGAALNYTVPLPSGSSATGFEIIDGTLPGGIQPTLADGAVKLVGSPTASGNYSFKLRVTTSDGAEEYSFTISVTEPAPTPTPAATPSPTPVPTPSPTPQPVAPTITKDPTAETVMEGGTCYFIARADDAIEIIWRVESPDGKTSYDAKTVGTHFSGASADGYNDETLQLSGIPYEMNGWKAVCKFVGEGNTSVFSKGALITVEKSGLMRPSITRDPFVTSDSDTLSVSATDPNGGTLYYQWYSSKNNSNMNTDGADVTITGATSATYVPPETEGTVYYYCGVWSVKDGEESEKSYSRVAAVTHAAAATPEPTVAPIAEPSGETDDVSPTPAQPSRASTQRNSASRFLLILMGVLILALVAAAVSLVIISKREKELDEADERAVRAAAAKETVEKQRGAAQSKTPAPAAYHGASLDEAKEALMPKAQKAEPVAEAAEETAASEDETSESAEELAEDAAIVAAAAETASPEASAVSPEDFVLDGWYCEKCGTFNRGHNCKACGAVKPKDAIAYMCDYCGWTNPDPSHPPRFCPDCGKPFTAQDKAE